MTTNQICPGCGATMARDVRDEEIRHNGQAMTIAQPGWYCTSCDEAVLTLADIRATEPAIVDFRARADGLLSAPEIAEIRETVLKISQRRAGLLLGGGPRAFQKYESRKATVSKPMSNLLRLLRNHPEHLRELEQQAGS